MSAEAAGLCSDELDQPPAQARYRRHLTPVGVARELWGARAIVLTLAERELRVRYKQAVLGFAWAVATPLVLMLAFTLVFKRAARVDIPPVPYPLYAFVGLVPWTFFSTSVTQGGLSLVNNVSLLNKVYCPREVFPMASVMVAGLDAVVASVVLGALFVVFGFTPGLTAVWVPVLLAVQVAFALGVALCISSVVVYLRDLKHALPIILQLGLFMTPVAFPLDLVPSRLRHLYVAVNPLGSVIDGYRRTLLLGMAPAPGLLAVAAGSAALTLVAGYVVFKRLEGGMSDVA